MDMVGKSIGSGIRVDYSNKEAKLEVYFQIPTLQQLLELKITKFNQDHKGVTIFVKTPEGEKRFSGRENFFERIIVHTKLWGRHFP